MAVLSIASYPPTRRQEKEIQMRSRYGLSSALAAAVLALAACAPKAAAPAQTMQESSTPEGMAMEATATAESMTMNDAATADSMMMHATPPAEGMAPTAAGSMQMADWLGTPLQDAATDAPFEISDYNGKVVLVETMAVWCTNCRAQQEEIQGLESEMMDQTHDLVIVSLDIDPNEDSGTLKKYVQTTGFGWTFAVAPPELIRKIGNTYGDQFLNPPSTPVLIIDREGVAHPLPFGIKSTQDLNKAVEPLLEASS
jgi:thiol-disulfide isomerase/thioredoxin